MQNLQITAHSINHATLEYDEIEPWGTVHHTREFWAPEGGGYVRELQEGRPGTLSPQVCAGLRGTGSTLVLFDGCSMADLIRDELEVR